VYGRPPPLNLIGPFEDLDDLSIPHHPFNRMIPRETLHCRIWTASVVTFMAMSEAKYFDMAENIWTGVPLTFSSIILADL
jgi:hypothetical protein